MTKTIKEKIEDLIVTLRSMEIEYYSRLCFLSSKENWKETIFEKCELEAKAAKLIFVRNELQKILETESFEQLKKTLSESDPSQTYTLPSLWVWKGSAQTAVFDGVELKEKKEEKK